MTKTGCFQLLVQQWHEERSPFSSSLAEMIACPAYLRIIAMGAAALPLILEQLRQEADDPDHWHAALEAITGENPVPEDGQGDTVRMAEAWIAWEEERADLFMAEVSFQSYSVATIESPALRLDDITASLGQRDMITIGGGQAGHEVATGLLAPQENSPSELSVGHFKDSGTKSAMVIRWRPDTKRSPSLQDWMEHQPTQHDSWPMASGRANLAH